MAKRVRGVAQPSAPPSLQYGPLAKRRDGIDFPSGTVAGLPNFAPYLAVSGLTLAVSSCGGHVAEIWRLLSRMIADFRVRRPAIIGVHVGVDSAVEAGHFDLFRCILASNQVCTLKGSWPGVGNSLLDGEG